MKYLALLSGGKDSCYNVLKAEQEGHTLVCLANLCPPEGAGEEMNSFMYQSAAHGIIPQMAECFGVPLIRRAITGKAVCQNLDYEVDTEEVDEVEDLYLLLAEIVEKYPEIKGVSCGAILSTYQRLRVENVCNRLGLTPLTYLWQMDRSQLLDELCDHQFEVILVKVAGAGLDPYKHLGKTLSSLKPQLYNLHHKLGLDLCGEGGEYESLVLDCPLFRKSGKRLKILCGQLRHHAKRGSTSTG
jgi:diphthine-ammonia ligase